MRKLLAAAMLLGVLCTLALPTSAQSPRKDVIWARFTSNPITLDGVLNEPAWAQAESMQILWKVDAGIPGSGWKLESGVPVSYDPTRAVLKWVAKDDSLYLGVRVPDVSIGGSTEFNRFDGLLMGLKNHADPAFPKPVAEYFYAWWFDETISPNPQPAGGLPAFAGGLWMTPPIGTPRTPEQIQAWDARTTVNGISNDDDHGDDVGYTVEMRFGMTPMGYDITRAEGDVCEWNMTIYDTDWNWFEPGTYGPPPGGNLDPLRFICTRTWWQSPWGNTAWYHQVEVHARPDVTVAGEPLPAVGPDVVISEIPAATVTVDGQLTEPVWSNPSVYSFDIRWDDSALRATYPGTGKYRSGQFQPEVHGGKAIVADPADATVKIFFKDDFLYMGFDARDHLVQYHPVVDRWDGFIVTINDMTTRGPDNNRAGRRLSFQVGETGAALPQDYLAQLVTQGDANVAIHLMSGTTVDTLYTPDNGYTAELQIDLVSLGFAPGLGDGTAFIGVDYLDGDSFSDPFPISDSYGTRTWWFREYENQCCPAWTYLQPAGTPADPVPVALLDGLVKSYPSPSIRPTIEYSLAQRSTVYFELYDVRGRLVERRLIGPRDAGVNQFQYDGSTHPAGVYFYRLQVTDPASGSSRANLQGRMVLVK